MVGRQKSRPFWACVGSRPWQLSALRDSAQRVSLRPRIDRRGFGRPSAPFPFALRLPQHGCKVTDERRTSTWSRIISDFSCSCSKTRERSLWARLATPESSRPPAIPATSGSSEPWQSRRPRRPCTAELWQSRRPCAVELLQSRVPSLACIQSMLSRAFLTRQMHVTTK